MDLLLFRHGIAQDRSAEVDDSDRPLTPRGIERTRLAAVGLARIAERPELVLSSPKTRAVQTAHIVGQVFEREPEVWTELADDTIDPLMHRLRDRGEDSVMLIGHEPTLTSLITRLCFRNVAGGAALGSIELKKAGAALIEAGIGQYEPRRAGCLRWLIPPRALRALGEVQVPV
ncbi:MAG: phosphohistidine phosphatase SixA [Planctomycetota bacterium]